MFITLALKAKMQQKHTEVERCGAGLLLHQRRHRDFAAHAVLEPHASSMVTASHAAGRSCQLCWNTRENLMPIACLLPHMPHEGPPNCSATWAADRPDLGSTDKWEHMKKQSTARETRTPKTLPSKLIA